MEAEDEASELRREIGLLDLVFLSFGGQSPFLSILSYGVAVFALVGGLAPIAILLGTLMVLVNGLVVYRLSMRFTKAGGYYTYAYYSLTKRLGFETGWIYTIYSTVYGAAYIVAATISLETALKILARTLGVGPSVDPLALMTGIFAVSSTFLILGIKPTAKYAMIASGLEAGIMVALAFMFIASTGWRFYNPFSSPAVPTALASAVLLGAAIPTGYGSIAPVSGEVKNPKRNVPLAVVTVILLGGSLAALDIYAVADHIIYVGGGSSMLQLIADRFGLLTLAFVFFAALNDGILATLAYMVATSRTIYAMSYHGFLPSLFNKVHAKSGPLYAALAAIGLYAVALYPIVATAPDLSTAFITMGFLAMLANIVVHVSANLSLLRISLKRISKRWWELALSVAATVLTTYIALQSIGGIQPGIVSTFMGLIVLGFLVAEARDMILEGEEE